MRWFGLVECKDDGNCTMVEADGIGDSLERHGGMVLERM